MVPAAFTGDTVMDLAKKMEPGDIIIDGGNSYYRDDVDRAPALAEMGIHYVDCGTSGGVFGLERGFCLMIGGEDDVVAHLDPIFKTIAPGRRHRAAHRTGSPATPSTAENGYLHCGPNGAGHFVKMVHNGIEYGMMAAYAEGLNVLKHANAGTRDARRRRRDDAAARPAVLPVRPRPPRGRRGVAAGERRGVVAARPRRARVLAVADARRLRGSGVRLGRGALDRARRDRRGRARSTCCRAALFDRFESRGASDFADKILSAMRKEFGGHDEKA